MNLFFNSWVILIFLFSCFEFREILILESDIYTTQTPISKSERDQINNRIFTSVNEEEAVCLNDKEFNSNDNTNQKIHNKVLQRVAIGKSNYLYRRIWLCGGTLLSDKFILTSASCLTKLGRSDIFMANINGKLDSPEKSRYKISRVFPHPQYKPPSIYHDIALIELEQLVELSEFVKPACRYSGEDLESRNLTTSGWQFSFFGTTHQELEEAEMFLVSTEECQNVYKDFPKRLPYGIVEEIQICAAEYVEDSCKSEAGSSLEFTVKDTSYLIGIKSFGNTCNLHNIPVVYTLIIPYIPWIESIIKNVTNKNLAIELDFEKIASERLQNNGSTEEFYTVVSDRKCLIYREDKDAELRNPEFVKITLNIIGIGGEEATAGEFPHMVALGYSTSDNITPDIFWKCGGNIISEKFVLTAAHCLNSNDRGLVKWAQTHIHIGTYHFLLRPEQVIYKVKRRIRHPMYKYPLFYHDIALLELERNVDFDKFTRPACLYTNPYIEPNTTLIATGWGLTETHEPSEHLIKVYLDVFTYTECNASFDGLSSLRLKDGIVADIQICAGKRTGLHDTCKGDSGGALQFKTPVYELMSHIVGVVSFGKPGCGIEGSPGVYTRVAPYIPWIESIVWPEEYKPVHTRMNK